MTSPMMLDAKVHDEIIKVSQTKEFCHLVFWKWDHKQHQSFHLAAELIRLSSMPPFPSDSQSKRLSALHTNLLSWSTFLSLAGPDPGLQSS
jgi:hypothetical protein